jgi:uncharacterized repeat protein (TIGR03803 family)
MQRCRSLRFVFLIFNLAMFFAATSIASPAQSFSTIYNFCSQRNCNDGGGPQAGLVQATDGNFYGTTKGGGSGGWGTVFKVTPGGTLTTLVIAEGLPGTFFRLDPGLRAGHDCACASPETAMTPRSRLPRRPPIL